MQVVVNIPDQFVHDLLPEGTPPEQALLEQLVVGAYREGRLHGWEQVRILLGLDTRMQAVEVLGRHEVDVFSAEHLEEDLATLQRLFPTPVAP